jgi:hypothetical protein
MFDGDYSSHARRDQVLVADCLRLKSSCVEHVAGISSTHHTTKGTWHRIIEGILHFLLTTWTSNAVEAGSDIPMIFVENIECSSLM